MDKPPHTPGPRPTTVTHSLTQCASPIVSIQILTLARPPHLFHHINVAFLRGDEERRVAIIHRLVNARAPLHQLRVS